MAGVVRGFIWTSENRSRDVRQSGRDGSDQHFADIHGRLDRRKLELKIQKEVVRTKRWNLI